MPSALIVGIKYADVIILMMRDSAPDGTEAEMDAEAAADASYGLAE